ncbi:hypothetical protein ACGF07_33005 [Kitasatospora sp. NPDC048194]|uniref:hypothetical protein n=1 Tax=Kitasatospora sp. NPDC048194 TaxID=3364045 RepID=UPI0037249639
MNTDGASAAADLADALADFAERACVPGSPGEVWVTVGTPHEIEQRTVRLPTAVVDWITELLEDEAEVLDQGRDGHGAGGLQVASGPGGWY